MSKKRNNQKSIEFFGRDFTGKENVRLASNRVVCEFPDGACIEIRERPEWPGWLEIYSDQGQLLVTPYVTNVIRVRPAREI